MPDFKIGDRVRVRCGTSSRKGEIGTIIDVVPNITFDDRFQSYVLQFDTDRGRVSEHYLQYELYLPVHDSCNAPSMLPAGAV